MSANELRKDYLLERWVVIAKERKKRPTDFAQKPIEKPKTENCPFCPGNEHMTPPAMLVYLPVKKSIKKEKDSDGTRHKNWLVRIVPNMYPAFTPPMKEKKRKSEKRPDLAPAFGHHEVVIESPNHEEHPSTARLTQLTLATNATLDRAREFSTKPYVKYVSVFRNHGKEAGASLSHAHTQIIATSFVPKLIEDEAKAQKDYNRRHRKCFFCKIMKDEQKSQRFIWENNHFLAFAPWASVNPFEFWVLPKRHSASILEMKKKEIESLAKTLRVCLGGLKCLLNDPPYNYGFHIAPPSGDKEFHWHLEVYPKLAIWAGFEKSTGIYINVIPPEDAATSLRCAVSEEDKRLKC